MKHKNLKRGIYTSPQSGTEEFERYVIENQQDLNLYLKHFPHRMTMMGEHMKNALEEGHIIVATDEHRVSGHPTYCYEAKDKDNQHPSSFHRVRLIEK